MLPVHFALISCSLLFIGGWCVLVSTILRKVNRHDDAFFTYLYCSLAGILIVSSIVLYGLSQKVHSNPYMLDKGRPLSDPKPEIKSSEETKTV